MKVPELRSPTPTFLPAKSLIEFILSVFFLTTLISLNVNSQNQKAPNGPHDCSYLDLTEAQKTKVEAIHLQKRTSLAEMRADLNVKKAELEKMRVTDASEKDINAKKCNRI